MSTRVLERVDLAAGVALQFLDAASGRPVRDGLRCELRTVAGDALVAPAVRTPSGTHHWPALAERWLATPSPLQPARAEVWVCDVFERFLPFRLAWPPAPAVGRAPVPVVLCSGPARAAPAGSATVQALLADAAGLPAAWARVLVAGGSGAAVPGMSDAQGRLTVHLPFPRPDRRAGGHSPPSPPADAAWPQATITLAFHHSAAVADDAAARGAPRVDLWLAQSERRALADVSGTPLGARRVVAGVPLVLRTEGSPADRSDLRLVPL